MQRQFGSSANSSHVSAKYHAWVSAEGQYEVFEYDGFIFNQQARPHGEREGSRQDHFCPNLPDSPQQDHETAAACQHPVVHIAAGTLLSSGRYTPLHRVILIHILQIPHLQTHTHTHSVNFMYGLVIFSTLASAVSGWQIGVKCSPSLTSLPFFSSIFIHM